jgi:Tol biopolymer transport system component
LSPDGQQALVFRLEIKSVDIWLLDLRRDVFLRLTTNPATDRSPVWSADGKRFVFASNRLGAMDIFRGIVGSEAQESPLVQSSVDKYPLSWSADGRFLLYTTRGNTSKEDLWILPVDQSKAGTPFPFAISPASESDGKFSPDGRWIAYTSDETGSREVYVRSFSPPAERGAVGAGSPAAGSRTRVSTSGAFGPRWRRDGRELFYVGANGMLMAVAVRLAKSFEAENPQPLFPIAQSAVWDVAADGKRFLVGVPVEQRGQVPFKVVVNWTAGLKQP